MENNLAVIFAGSMLTGFFLVRSLKAEALKVSLQWLVLGILVNTLIMSQTFTVAKSLVCVTAAWLSCYGAMRFLGMGRS